MSARDELKQVIVGYFGPTLAINSYKTPQQQDDELTDAILAAGYRKPRTIATTEELDALPVGAVLLSSELNPWQIDNDEDGERWYVANADTYFTSEIFMRQRGPFTVIWEPRA